MSDAVTSCRVRRGDRHDTGTLTLTDASQANPEVKASLTGRCMQPMLPPPLDQPGSPDGIYDGVKAGHRHHQPQPQIGHNCNLTSSRQRGILVWSGGISDRYRPQKHDGGWQTMFTDGGKHETHVCSLFMCLSSASGMAPRPS